MVFSPELALKTSRYPISTLYLPLPYQYRIPMGRGGAEATGGVWVVKAAGPLSLERSRTAASWIGNHAQKAQPALLSTLICPSLVIFRSGFPWLESGGSTLSSDQRRLRDMRTVTASSQVEGFAMQRRVTAHCVRRLQGRIFAISLRKLCPVTKHWDQSGVLVRG